METRSFPIVLARQHDYVKPSQCRRVSTVCRRVSTVLYIKIGQSCRRRQPNYPNLRSSSVSLAYITPKASESQFRSCTMAYFGDETDRKKKAAALLLLMQLRENDDKFLQSQHLLLQGKVVCYLMFLSLVEQARAGTDPVALGENCSDDPVQDECTLSDSNSKCDTGFTDMCICSAGYVEESAVCRAVVGIGCTLNSQCTDLLVNTVCSSSQCACVSGSTGPTCSDVVIGMACADDCDCQDMLSNTVCMSLQCKCAAGFSGLECSSNSAGELSKTPTIATILLSVIYKFLS